MKNPSELDRAAATHLGTGGSYAVYTDKPDKSLLVRMPREDGRKEHYINPDRFVGVDVWHAHESTFLLHNGLPVAGTLKIVYSAHSKWMVESKSLKLYLNTFDMYRVNSLKIEKGVVLYVEEIKNDLEDLLEVSVDVGFFSEVLNNYPQNLVHIPEEKYKLLDLLVQDIDERFDYALQHNYLKFQSDFRVFKEEGKRNFSRWLRTNLLRSRCRHTKQKDSGSMYLYYNGDKDLVPRSVLNQVISLREVNEFHEFCAEKLFSAFMESKDVVVRDLHIFCLYARRGGIDINPVRATSWDLIPEEIISAEMLIDKTIIQ